MNEEGYGYVEFLSTLQRHQGSVNTVRFSPTACMLASVSDDKMVLVWKLAPNSLHSAPALFGEESDNLETWNVFKSLRGHLEDIYDVAWSPDGQYLITGSVDNSAMLWDVMKGHSLFIFKDHDGFVQGVTWDPLNRYLVTCGCDRVCRIYSVKYRHCICKIRKLQAPDADSSTSGKSRTVNMFHDETSQGSFWRRPAFSPDGELLLLPAGCLEQGEKTVNTVFVFTRLSLAKPVMHLPVGDTPALVVRFCPLLFALRQPAEPAASSSSDASTKTPPTSLINLPYRMVFAVGTAGAVLLYTTQYSTPIAYITDIHAQKISDLSWSEDGTCLAVSSQDGFCSIVTFAEGELGTPYVKRPVGQ